MRQGHTPDASFYSITKLTIALIYNFYNKIGARYKIFS